MATTTHLQAVRKALSNFSTDAREFQFIVQTLEKEEFESVIEGLKSRFDDKHGPAHVILAAHIFKRILSVPDLPPEFRALTREALDEMNNILRTNGYKSLPEPVSTAADPAPPEAETAASTGAALAGVAGRNPPPAEQRPGL